MSHGRREVSRHLGFATCTLIVVLAIPGRPLAAQNQAPTKIDQIPLYPGATRAREAEQTDAAQRLYMVGEYERAYTVPAAIEEVVRFYRERLGAREMRSDADLEQMDRTRDNLKPGSASPVWLEIQLRDMNDLESWSDVLPPVTPERVRQALVRRRPPYRPGEWVHTATFSWVQRVGEHEQELKVWLTDSNADELFEAAYRPVTFMRFSRGETAAEAAAAERLAEEAAREDEPRRVQSEEPGVALYPGARFDPEMSGQLSSGDDATYFVYTTADDPAMVLSFYERRTGRKAAGHGEGGSIIVLRGAAPWPDLGVVVEPNRGAYPASVRTVITIRKTG